MKWQAQFVGRELNAIGIFHPIETIIDGDTEREAELALYERYDHISRLKLTPTA